MGLASWSRVADLADLAPLMREPAPARRFTRTEARLQSARVRWGICLLAGMGALLLLAIALGALLAGHGVTRISARVSSSSGESPAAFARQTAAFEGRYPFLTELRRVEPSRFERLDGAVRLGFRRGAAAAELNAYVAETAGDIERGRLADVDDGSALRLLVALRTAARRFQSLDPSQCIAILRLRSTAPVRSAAALAAISPALVGLLDAPAKPRGAAGPRDAPQQGGDPLSQTLPGAGPDAPGINPKLDCDRLLLLYDTAVAAGPDTGATFMRALQGGTGH
jgi:hypothetical protein